MDLDLTGALRPNKAQPIFGTCILCEEHKSLARSHVVSDWMRARVFDNKAKNGNGFRFRHLDDDTERTSEGLTTLPLMCGDCDNKFSSVEGLAAIALLGNFSLTKSPECNSLISAQAHSVTLTEGKSDFELPLWIPQGTRDSGDKALLRFGILTAWRALHAVERRQANPAVTSFLASPEGVHLNRVTRNMLLDKTFPPESFEFRALVTGFAPYIGHWITGMQDELPADCWAFVDAGEGCKAMAVLAGHWLIIWPMTKPANRNLGKLEQAIWREWIGQTLRSRFAESTSYEASARAPEQQRA